MIILKKQGSEKKSRTRSFLTLALLLVLILLFALVSGCSSDDNDPKSSKTGSKENDSKDLNLQLSSDTADKEPNQPKSDKSNKSSISPNDSPTGHNQNMWQNQSPPKAEDGDKKEATSSKPEESKSKPNDKSEHSMTDDDKVFNIREKMFLTQINDIYFNFEQYKDYTIVVEGMYGPFTSFDGTTVIPAVYRRGPGCCGNDGWGGFMLNYDGEFPEENAWVKVTGKPLKVKVDDVMYLLYLNVESIEVLEERGAEFVLQ